MLYQQCCASQVTVRDMSSGALVEFVSGQWLGISPNSSERGPLGTQSLHLLPAGLGVFTFCARWGTWGWGSCA